MERLTKFLVSLMIILCICFQSNAQDHDNNVHYSLENMQNGFTAGEVFKTPSQKKKIEVEGSPYFDEEYSSMVLSLKDKQIPIQKGRFNIFDERIEMVISEGLYEVSLSEVQSFSLQKNGESLVFKRNEAIADFEDRFFQVSDINEEVDLYIKTEIIYKKPTYNEKLAKGDKNGKLLRKNTYYLVSEEKAQAIKKKSDLTEFFDKKAVNQAWAALEYCELKDMECLQKLLNRLK